MLLGPSVVSARREDDGKIIERDRVGAVEAHGPPELVLGVVERAELMVDGAEVGPRPRLRRAAVDFRRLGAEAFANDVLRQRRRARDGARVEEPPRLRDERPRVGAARRGGGRGGGGPPGRAAARRRRRRRRALLGRKADVRRRDGALARDAREEPRPLEDDAPVLPDDRLPRRDLGRGVRERPFLKKRREPGTARATAVRWPTSFASLAAKATYSAASVATTV